MSDFRKERFTLDEAMRIAGVEWKEGVERHLKFDPDVQPQYRIIRQVAHDGTQIFTSDLFRDGLWNLLVGNSYYIKEPPREGMAPVYTVGRIQLATVYGRVEVPAGKIYGQRERIRIPVSVEWVPAAAAKGKA